MKISEALKKSRGFIDTPDKWIKGHYRTTQQGKSRYCLVGAIRAGTAEDKDYDFYGGPGNAWLTALCLQQVLTAYPTNSSIESFNDSPQTTHAAVMRVLDKAIEMAETEELMEQVKAEAEALVDDVLAWEELNRTAPEEKIEATLEVEVGV